MVAFKSELLGLEIPRPSSCRPLDLHHKVAIQ
jgi:hypothetical protein